MRSGLKFQITVDRVFEQSEFLLVLDGAERPDQSGSDLRGRSGDPDGPLTQIDQMVSTDLSVTTVPRLQSRHSLVAGGAAISLNWPRPSTGRS